jgi:hypothetical protein
LFARGIALGLAIGVCLAGVVGLLYRTVHSPDASPLVYFYFFSVGSVMGLIGGWCLSLQMTVNEVLSSLFLKISEKVPAPAAAVTEEWAKKMEGFFAEGLKPLPSLLRKIVAAFLAVRFRDYTKINRVIEKAKQRTPVATYSPEWMSQVALRFFLEPVWLFFYGAYGVLFLVSCVFWSLAFFHRA